MFHDPAWGTMRSLFDRHPKVASFVGDLSIPDSPDALPDHAFADQSTRRFPIHEKRAAALSYLYAREQAVPRSVMLTIKEALSAYDLDEKMFEPEQAKVAALAASDCLFPDMGAWPIRTSDEVKMAQEALHREAHKLQPEARVEAYGRLYKRAQELGVALDARSHKYAGFVETDARELRDNLRARAVLVEKTSSVGDAVRGKIRDAFNKLASTVEEKPGAFRSRPNQVKLASAVAELDAQAGVTGRYDRGLPDPMATVFNTTKIARSDDLDLAGTRVSLSKLASLPSSFYADALGDDFARELAPGGSVSTTKLAEILPTLPLDMKRTLAVALRSTGR